jgi:hypothetical protein
MLILEGRQIEESRRKEKARIQPVFQWLGSRASPGSDEIDFRNSGGRARHLLVKDTPGVQIHIRPTDVIDSGAKAQFLVVGMSSFPTVVRVQYLDEHDERYELLLEFHTKGDFRQIEAGLPVEPA